MDLETRAREILLRNRRTTNGHRYTIPSPSTYPYQWLWDSCFHAIVLSQYDPEYAKDEIRALLSRQFSDGMVPHMIYWEPGELHNFEWGVVGTSSLTQPPMIAYAVWEIHRRTPDRSYLAEMYPKLLAHYKYLITARDPHLHNLISIVNPDESGEDNSPRFDLAMHARSDISYDAHLDLRRHLVAANRGESSEIAHRMHEVFWVKDVPFNAILVKNLQVLAHIAALVNDPEGEHFATTHADSIKSAMREKMFDRGVYWSTTGSDYSKLRVETWAHFAPLFADLYTREEAIELLEKHFHNSKTLRGEWGIRTVSKSEPSYRPNGFWRGPVWMVPHWFIYKGLVAYGFTEEANEIRDMSKKLLEKSDFREYFNPETGEGYGAEDFTWGTLVLDMRD
jgi:glycogen debranching enzyme